MGKIATEATLQRAATAEERSADALETIAIALSGGEGKITSYKMLLNLIKGGLIKRWLQVGDQISVNKESGLSVTVAGGVTAATVNEETFVAAAGHAGTAAYEFIYDGAAWHLDGEAVELATYGINITGTPAEGDAVVVHETASEIIFDVVNIDDTHRAVDLLTRDLLHYGAIPFCPAQGLYAVVASKYPDGLPAGTYKVVCDHAAYNGGTNEDGTFYFTTTQVVPVGGMIRHTAMGQYRSAYAKETVLAGTFTTYDATGATIETGLVTSEGDTGTLLGKTTACDPQYKEGDEINFTHRQFYGSNRYANSVSKMWLESAAAGAASGAVASWWKKMTIWDLPVKSTMPGFLHGLDPEFVSCIAKVTKRTAKCIADGYGYEDTEELVWLPSMTEMGYGKNNNIQESNVFGGTPVDNPFELFDGASNDERIKTYTGTARYWWLRSPHPSYGGVPRSVDASGALYGISAFNSFGVPAGLTLM